MDMLQKKKTDRFLFLKNLYDRTNGNRLKYVNMFEIGKDLKLDNKELESIVWYLNDEGLLRIVAMGEVIEITHAGIVEIEEAISDRTKPTRHFPPDSNIIVIEHMESSQIQQGTNQSVQELTVFSGNVEGLNKLLEELELNLSKLSLPNEGFAELTAEINTLKGSIIIAQA